ncbi:glycosyltransferase [Nesterenkonia aurantiaca]|uniref:glycosyltransferase n=1 Tax=Nesterenkonia aurantiaca TaxID=1436010 RepID=UPI001414D076|nr:glycosyltransferase [Nesterenkonia aurantiaca]
MTFENPQSISLLDGKRVEYVDYIPPRGWKQIFKASRTIRGILKEEDFDVVVSTGAGIALASHPHLALSGSRPVYIESVSRVEGPSLSGLILERMPGVTRFSQHTWGRTRRGWRQEFSILDTFEPVESQRHLAEAKRFFVTLGTIRPYEFGALVEALDQHLPPDAEIVWQTGVTTARPSRGTVYEHLDGAAFAREVHAADVVISHAGVGSLIALLESGAEVIAVPRRATHNEHVDSHQLQIAKEFERRGLLKVLQVPEITSETLAGERVHE